MKTAPMPTSNIWATRILPMVVRQGLTSRTMRRKSATGISLKIRATVRRPDQPGQLAAYETTIHAISPCRSFATRCPTPTLDSPMAQA